VPKKVFEKREEERREEGRCLTLDVKVRRAWIEGKRDDVSLFDRCDVSVTGP
jgi:hypothetical protein